MLRQTAKKISPKSKPPGSKKVSYCNKQDLDKKLLHKAVNFIVEYATQLYKEEELKPLEVEEAEQDHNNHETVMYDSDKRLVTGIVIEPQVFDTHGDIIDAQEIENACYEFMERYQQVGVQHQFEGPAKVVESWITKDDALLGKQKVRKGSWIMTVRIDESPEGNKVWELIKSGKITGFSFGGQGEVHEYE